MGAVFFPLLHFPLAAEDLQLNRKMYCSRPALARFRPWHLEAGMIRRVVDSGTAVGTVDENILVAPLKFSSLPPASVRGNDKGTYAHRRLCQNLHDLIGRDGNVQFLPF